jgi:hypothetical protein
VAPAGRGGRTLRAWWSPCPVHDEHHRGQDPPHADPGTGAPAMKVRTRLLILLLAALPWLVFGGVVAVAWWLFIFDGKPQTDALGLVLLGLSLPILFATVGVSRWERRWLRTRFNLEATAASGRRGGGLSDLLDW